MFTTVVVLRSNNFDSNGTLTVVAVVCQSMGEISQHLQLYPQLLCAFCMLHNINK